MPLEDRRNQQAFAGIVEKRITTQDHVPGKPADYQQWLQSKLKKKKRPYNMYAPDQQADLLQPDLLQPGNRSDPGLREILPTNLAPGNRLGTILES